MMRPTGINNEVERVFIAEGTHCLCMIRNCPCYMHHLCVDISVNCGINTEISVLLISTHADLPRHASPANMQGSSHCQCVLTPLSPIADNNSASPMTNVEFYVFI